DDTSKVAEVGPMRRLALVLVLAQALCTAQAAASTRMKRPQVPPANSVPVDQLAQRERDLVSPVVDKATLAVRGPAEIFKGNPRNYQYFLDHPDRAVTAWRRLGAKC